MKALCKVRLSPTQYLKWFAQDAPCFSSANEKFVTRTAFSYSISKRFAQDIAYSSSMNENFFQNTPYFTPVNKNFCKMVDIVRRGCGATNSVWISTRFMLALTKLFLTFIIFVVTSTCLELAYIHPH